jgi:hypothetical protein
MADQEKLRGMNVGSYSHTHTHMHARPQSIKSKLHEGRDYRLFESLAVNSSLTSLTIK